MEINDIRGHESLLAALRESLGLSGSKNACEQGACGSCTVYLDDAIVCACLVPVGQAEGRSVRTIEDLRDDERFPALQEAFLAAGAVQCGFCTPGLVVAAHNLMCEVPDPSDFEIREALAGNLCRCTGYALIVDAVRQAASSIQRPSS